MGTTECSCTRGSRWRTTPALLISVLALIISVSGTGVAVAAAAKNSIGNKQLKSNAVSSGKIRSNGVQSSDIKSSTIQSSDVKNGSLLAGDFKPGQLAPKPPGSHKVFFAQVTFDGSLLAKSPQVLSSKKVATGTYDVTFAFDVRYCAFVGSSLHADHSVGAFYWGQNTVQIYVKRTADNASVDSLTSLVVVC